MQKTSSQVYVALIWVHLERQKSLLDFSMILNISVAFFSPVFPLIDRVTDFLKRALVESSRTS